jgi:hypothetical protein
MGIGSHSATSEAAGLAAAPAAFGRHALVNRGRLGGGIFTRQRAEVVGRNAGDLRDALWRYWAARGASSSYPIVWLSTWSKSTRPYPWPAHHRCQAGLRRALFMFTPHAMTYFE